MTTDKNDGSSEPGRLETVLAAGPAVGHWSLDSAASSVSFHEKHFWGAITVHGTFGQVSGGGTIGADGIVTGRLTVAAASLSTNNDKRDQHLRSPDFFDVDRTPAVVIDVASAELAGPAALTCRGTIEAAGHREPIEFMAAVEQATPDSVRLRAEITVDRRTFSMTWSPLGMASRQATGTVVARFVHD